MRAGFTSTLQSWSLRLHVGRCNANLFGIMDTVQQDEIIAIQAIFGEEVVQHVALPNELKICIPSIGSIPCIELHVFIPQNIYPSSSPPVFELHCDLFDSSTISDLARQMENMFQPGEVILYTWIAFLQEEWEQRKPPAPPPLTETDANTPTALPAAAKQKEPSEINEETANHLELMRRIAAKLVHGEPLTEKKSTFQAHLVPIKDPAEIPPIIEYLLQNNKIRAATHNIMAYRIEGSRQGAFLQDCDDDGESAAGGRLLHLLQMVDARNVVVVVSRWFGGTLLGPARFGLINKAARELLESQGMIRSGGEKSR
ncbi:hypothetical protein Ndes2437B_g05496 [Nannochloris sp. 'desiccata']